MMNGTAPCQTSGHCSRQRMTRCGPTAAAVHIAVVRCGAVHLCGELVREARRLRARAVRVHRGLPEHDRQVAADVALVRLHEVRAARRRERDTAHRADAALRGVLVAAVAALEGLEQSAVPLVGGWEIERESGVGAFEATVHVPMPHRGVPLLVDVDPSRSEERIGHRAPLVPGDLTARWPSISDSGDPMAG